MTPEQCAQARFLLGWTRDKLGTISGVGTHVVSNFEKTGYVQPPRSLKPQMDRAEAMQAALQDAGVEFTSGDPPGVWLRPEGKQ